jgi:hypothetical protein
MNVRGGTFSKNYYSKEGPKHCQYTFYFLINTILFLKFQYNGHLGSKVSTMVGHDHLVKLSSGLLSLKLSSTLLL